MWIMPLYLSAWKAVAIKMQHLSQPENSADPKGRAAELQRDI